MYLVMLLLEKSAVFLLMASALILLLPIILFALLIYAAVSLSKYLKHRKEIRLWLSEAKLITVYLTSEKIFTEKPKLFLRAASFEASEYSHPVIVLCSDRIISLKWYGINLLGIRPECFFSLKNSFLSKSESIINYIIIN